MMRGLFHEVSKEFRAFPKVWPTFLNKLSANDDDAKMVADDAGES